MSTPASGRPPRRPASSVIAGVRWVLGLGLLALLPTTVVFVDETEFVLVERLGRIVAVYDRPDDRGWQWKAPWPIDAVRRFDSRVQLLTPPGREVFTADRKNLVVEPFLCWRIAGSPTENAPPLADRPVVRFFRSLQTRESAETRIASRLQSVLTTEFGRRPMSELFAVRDAAADRATDAGPLTQLAAAIQSRLQQQGDEAEPWTDRLGITVESLSIRRINLPAGNQQAVYERMRSERQRIAERYRSAGQADSVLIRSQADRLAGEALAMANAEADRIRAAGEAEALRTLNAAYAKDPEFAQRLQMLDAYRQMLNQQTTLVMSANSPLWKLLSSGGVSVDEPIPSAIHPENAPAAAGGVP
ncbi:MAG: protease modulator HflC [Planctomycetaceae bacterium]|nr:protease modulator HflC [Planctomycetaceae bacterium]